MNKYTNIAGYYDELMTNGYYDYEKIASNLNNIFQKCSVNQILELGVGTGIVAEEIIRIKR